MSEHPEHWNKVQRDLADELDQMKRVIATGEGLVSDYAFDWQDRLARIASAHQPFREADIEWCGSCGFSWPCETLKLAGALPERPNTAKGIRG